MMIQFKPFAKETGHSSSGDDCPPKVFQNIVLPFETTKISYRPLNKI